MRIPLQQRKELFAMVRRFMQGEDEMLDSVINLAGEFRKKLDAQAPEPQPVQNRMDTEGEARDEGDAE